MSFLNPISSNFQWFIPVSIPDFNFSSPFPFPSHSHGLFPFLPAPISVLCRGSKYYVALTFDLPTRKNKSSQFRCSCSVRSSSYGASIYTIFRFQTSLFSFQLQCQSFYTHVTAYTKHEN